MTHTGSQWILKYLAMSEVMDSNISEIVHILWLRHLPKDVREVS